MSPDRQALVVDMYQRGERVREIGAAARCGQPAIYRVLHAHGVKLRNKKRRKESAPRERPMADRDAEIVLAYALKKSQAAIARRHGITRARVAQILRAYGVRPGARSP